MELTATNRQWGGNTANGGGVVGAVFKVRAGKDPMRQGYIVRFALPHTVFTMTSTTPVTQAVVEFLSGRLIQLGRPAAVGADLQVFEDGVLDSVALGELGGVVERAAGCEVDMLAFDPTAIVTTSDLIDQLESALAA